MVPHATIKYSGGLCGSCLELLSFSCHLPSTKSVLNLHESLPCLEFRELRQQLLNLEADEVITALHHDEVHVKWPLRTMAMRTGKDRILVFMVLPFYPVEDDLVLPASIDGWKLPTPDAYEGPSFWMSMFLLIQPSASRLLGPVVSGCNS